MTTGPLKLKKPEGVRNWYRSGRWHRVRPKPGRTKFQVGDLCQFKPDLLDVRVISVWATASSDINLYLIRVEASGHEFSTYGNDLLLLERDKPELQFVWKPVFRLKKEIVKPKFVLKPKLLLPLRILWPEDQTLAPPEPEKGAIARLWYLVRWGPWALPRWVFQDFNNAKELEQEFWSRVEERRHRFYKYGVQQHRYGTFGDGKAKPYPINTDRRNHPEWVSVEWIKEPYPATPAVFSCFIGDYKPEFDYSIQQKERRRVESSDYLSTKGTPIRGRRSGGEPPATAGIHSKKRKSQQHSLLPRASKRKRHLSRKKKKTVADSRPRNLIRAGKPK